MTVWGKQNLNNAYGSNLISANSEPSPAAVNTVPGGGFPRVGTSWPSCLMRRPAGSALKAPCEMLMDQCIHSDGLRDKGGQNTDQYVLGTLRLPLASKGS